MRVAVIPNWEKKAIPFAGVKALASSDAVPLGHVCKLLLTFLPRPSILVSMSCKAIRRTAWTRPQTMPCSRRSWLSCMTQSSLAD